MRGVKISFTDESGRKTKLPKISSNFKGGETRNITFFVEDSKIKRGRGRVTYDDENYTSSIILSTRYLQSKTILF